MLVWSSYTNPELPQQVCVILLIGLPLHILTAEVGVDGRHVDARVLGCLFLNVGNDWGGLGDIVGPANLEKKNEET